MREIERVYKRGRKAEIKEKLRRDRERLKKGKKGGETGREVEEGEEMGRCSNS